MYYMKLIVSVGLLLMITSVVYGRSINITGPNRDAMLEGDSYNITWRSNGLASVSLVAYGKRTPLGTSSRGDFHYVIAQGVSARQGRTDWRVPFVDSVRFIVKAKGYNARGALVSIDERSYSFRPRVMARRTRDGLYLDLHRQVNQKLYVQKNRKITKAYLSSSSDEYYWRPRDRHVPRPHDHAGVFRILSKSRNHWSTMFQVNMPFAMRYHGGHFVHATTSNYYKYLGTPASNGCNRLTRHDAEELYRNTPIGTRIEVIGPNG